MEQQCAGKQVDFSSLLRVLYNLKFIKFLPKNIEIQQTDVLSFLHLFMPTSLVLFVPVLFSAADYYSKCVYFLSWRHDDAFLIRWSVNVARTSSLHTDKPPQTYRLLTLCISATRKCSVILTSCLHRKWECVWHQLVISFTCISSSHLIGFII